MAHPIKRQTELNGSFDTASYFAQLPVQRASGRHDAAFERLDWARLASDQVGVIAEARWPHRTVVNSHLFASAPEEQTLEARATTSAWSRSRSLLVATTDWALGVVSMSCHARSGELAPLVSQLETSCRVFILPGTERERIGAKVRTGDGDKYRCEPLGPQAGCSAGNSAAPWIGGRF